MKLQTKRKIFFGVVTVLFFILYGGVLAFPVLNWVDTCGILVFGIPMSQVMIWGSSFALAILISIVFYVDTKVLCDVDTKKELAK